MLNVSTITKALQNQLLNNSNVIQKQMIVKRGEYINTDPDLAPWVGIYKAEATCDPESMGRHSQSWKCNVQIELVVQASHLGSGEECEELLEEYLQVVKDAVWDDSTLGGTISMITRFATVYTYEKTKSETIFFQMAYVAITAEVRTG